MNTTSTPREQLLAMVSNFRTTGEATGTLHTDSYAFNVTMFNNNDYVVLTGVNTNVGGVPRVFALSDGKRVLFSCNHSYDLNNIYNACVENDESIDPMQRTMIMLSDLSNMLKNELITRCADVCQAYMVDAYGDRELLESCTCSDEDISIAASYCCTQILADTGSFEDMQQYVNTNIDEAILRDDRPAFETPTEFYRGVTEEETIRVFMNGEQAIADIAHERVNNRVVLAAYGTYAISMVKWFRDRQEILDNDEEFKIATTINQAIKAFQADDKYAKAKLLTYIVRDNEGHSHMFRLQRNVLMRKRGFSINDKVYRVPDCRRPLTSEMSSWSPFNVEEIRYIKHTVYKKAA